MKLFFFLLIAAGLGFGGWYVLQDEGTGSSPYPIERTITSADGRELDSVIIGKQGDTVHLRRAADGREFKLTADKLSPADAEFIARLPDGGINGAPPSRPLIWLDSIADAQAESRRKGVPILVMFEGTGWCHACEELENSVLSTTPFKSFANKEVVLLKLEFPENKSPKVEAKRIKDRYRVDAFPTAVLITARMKELGRIRGGAVTETYITRLRAMIDQS